MKCGRLPLHEAAERNPPFEVIEALLRVHPDAARTPDLDGNLPLHFAAGEKASLEVVAALLAAYPEAADVCSNAFNGSRPKLSNYSPLAILAALKAAAAARRWRAPIAWHMWHRM